MALKAKHTTHYNLATYLRRKGFIADMFDTAKHRHPNGCVASVKFNGGWSVEYSA